MRRQTRMPAEWEPQKALWFIWPSNPSLWPGKLHKIQAQFIKLLSLISQYTPISLLGAPSSRWEESTNNNFPSSLIKNPKITLFPYETDDVWCRDCGPIFLVAGSVDVSSAKLEELDQIQKYISDWQFNAWGEKFPHYQLDNGIPKYIAEQLKIPRIKRPTILEGGAIDVNGAGLCLTTEAVLLNKNRGSYSKEFIEEELKLLGISKTIWLKHGLINDDTDGHIDNIARFIDEKTIAVAHTDEPQNPNYDSIKKNLEILAQYPELKIIKVPLPDPVIFQEELLPASYLNFLITNKLVIVPIYDRPQDQEALNIFQKLFPSHKIKAFNCLDIIEEGGAIHCLSQQEPS